MLSVAASAWRHCYEGGVALLSALLAAAKNLEARSSCVVDRGFVGWRTHIARARGPARRDPLVANIAEERAVSMMGITGAGVFGHSGAAGVAS